MRLLRAESIKNNLGNDFCGVMRGREWVLQMACYLGISLPLKSGRLFSSLKICNLRLEPLIVYPV